MRNYEGHTQGLAIRFLDQNKKTVGSQDMHSHGQDWWHHSVLLTNAPHTRGRNRTNIPLNTAFIQLSITGSTPLALSGLSLRPIDILPEERTR